MSKNRVVNFNPGPAVLPESVLRKAQEELLNFNGTGMSILEISHRSKPFEAVLARADEGLRAVMEIPKNYKVLFLQGGASLQFSAVPMNLYQPGKPVDFIQTGVWTKKALKELKKIGEYRMAASTEADGFMRVPRMDEIQLSSDASYVYMCSNNTIYGTQFKAFPGTGAVPLVVDMSSDIASRQVDMSQFGVIFAGAQKNIGPSGVTVVIVREDLADRVADTVPTVLQYREQIKENSLYNTIPTFGVYLIARVMEWIQAQGGIRSLAEMNREKARRLYAAIDDSGVYSCPVQLDSRSEMNVVFRVAGGDEDLEKQFVKEAEAAGLAGLKGHRLVGGLRASIYNAQTLEGVDKLVAFMKSFAQTHKPALSRMA
jgi:phosphoserine aminotransferase